MTIKRLLCVRHIQCNLEPILYFVLSHLFVKVPRPGDSEVTVLAFESSCNMLLLIEPLKGRDNSVKCFDQGHNKWTCQLVLHTIFLMLNWT